VFELWAQQRLVARQQLQAAMEFWPRLTKARRWERR
jgi:hypothetical protein